MKAVKETAEVVAKNKVVPPLTVYDLALVLDRPVMTPKGRGTLIRIGSTELGCHIKIGSKEQPFKVDDIKPILSDVQKMDDFDMKKSQEVYDMYHKKNRNRTMVHVGLWLIRNGWDGLGWIGSGLAIEEMES